MCGFCNARKFRNFQVGDLLGSTGPSIGFLFRGESLSCLVTAMGLYTQSMMISQLQIQETTCVSHHERNHQPRKILCTNIRNYTNKHMFFRNRSFAQSFSVRVKLSDPFASIRVSISRNSNPFHHLGSHIQLPSHDYVLAVDFIWIPHHT